MLITPYSIFHCMGDWREKKQSNQGSFKVISTRVYKETVVRWTGCLARMKWISRYDIQSRIAEVLTMSRQRLISLSCPSLTVDARLSMSSIVQPCRFCQ